MPFSVLIPGSASAYWSAFASNVEGGAVRVPVPVADGVRSEALSSYNASPFAVLALDAVAQIQNQPMNPLVSGSSEETPSWTVEKFAEKTDVVATSSDGRRVRILPARVFGTEKSLKAEIGFCGLSGYAQVRQSVTVEKNHRHLVAVYEMRFSGAMLRGLRDFLGFSRLEPMAEVVAGGLRLLELCPPETMSLTEAPRRKGRRLERTTVGVNAAGQGVVAIWSQPDGPVGVEEELGLYLHASRENNALPASAAGLWNFIAEWSGRHDPKEKSVV